MKKEKIIKTHTRRTKSGKTVTVRQHRAKYDAAEEAKQLAKKIGAGKELEKKFSKGIPYDVLDSAPDSSVAGKKVDSKVKVKDPFTKTATKPKGHSSFDNKFFSFSRRLQGVVPLGRRERPKK